MTDIHKLIGDKASFAAELIISSGKWDNQTCIWINNQRLGKWEDKNLLGPFINSLYRVSEKYESFAFQPGEKQDCRQLFLGIHPLFEDPDAFFDLSEAEQDAQIPFDRFLIEWGENFDQVHLSMIYENNSCTFLWADEKEPHDHKRDYTYHCSKVPLQTVQNVYRELRSILTDMGITFSMIP